MTTLAKTAILHSPSQTFCERWWFGQKCYRTVRIRHHSGRLEPSSKYLADHGITSNGWHLHHHQRCHDFKYMIQTGNKGTWSTASVDVTAPEPVVEPHLSDKELVSNWDFEQNFITDGTEAAYFIGAPTGWTDLTNGAVTPELAKNWGGVGDDGSFGEGESQWLDSAGSPGNIDISTTLAPENDLAEGHTAQLSVSVAAQALSFGSQYTIPDDAELVFNFNGHEVLKINASDFGDDFNTFHTLTADVTGVEGADTLEIYSTHQDAANSGFAIDHVSVHEWLI